MSDQSFVATQDAVMVCDDVCKTYNEAGNEVEVLRSVSLSVGAGERIAIIGSSGSGKSTLLNMLGGLEGPTSGSVTVGGEVLYQTSEKRRSEIRNRMLGFVYQFHHLLPEFTAVENVAIPLMLAKQSPAQAADKAKVLLEKVGLSHRLSHKPAQLSGGERQRVAIARALVTEPACVLMDEPTGNLDRQTAAEIQALMSQLNQDLNTSFIIVTHDPDLAKKMDRIFELTDGGLVEITNH
ncbi:lipoprotein-releasing ABC transporter ATP-binding protein LolD [Neptunomonas phycophila]|jgi:lipoprotein-releasing system ATP-binding protein|uniref:Lipoprotein-releasing system ATP-binding protein LolD n=1 Tax=Neptunomonas phycophila TaxID=1572645 RepID=A0ABT9EXP0_9GAMM|nr:lipoprotein-releasing ABC transporter ATP-binding protein LolD [Neptunomonas phycophila]MBT3147384.1 lipoprotein-releasing ABC transporter ATP-binding protein LolD [Neptunomonas phycophila]MDO6785203.1 lipoprotein-releasing ABC transporter ATP-binding protein LolD [Neptunomonas phycophila]MDP2523771.1 lipoprotein-releasing ABC transporter ATP-binding protein LolD [Neptunomonas phycophila]QLE97509.1 lipoprotein-releasing ABC transporter ATP-binding protein LolD [Neptunomonas phycophila]